MTIQWVEGRCVLCALDDLVHMGLCMECIEDQHSKVSYAHWQSKQAARTPEQVAAEEVERQRAHAASVARMRELDEQARAETVEADVMRNSDGTFSMGVKRGGLSYMCGGNMTLAQMRSYANSMLRMVRLEESRAKAVAASAEARRKKKQAEYDGRVAAPLLKDPAQT